MRWLRWTSTRWVSSASAAIPTLSEWGLIIMSVLMLITGAIMYRRREQGLM